MRQWGAQRAVFTRRARLSGCTCDFEFQRPHPATPLNSSEEHFSQSRCFQIITFSTSVLSLVFLLFGVFQLIGIFLIKGVRGECFLVGVALVLDFFWCCFGAIFEESLEREENQTRMGTARDVITLKGSAAIVSEFLCTFLRSLLNSTLLTILMSKHQRW